MRTIVIATAAAAVFSGCAQAFAPAAGAPCLRPAAAARPVRSVALRMSGDSMDDIMARLAAMESGGGVAAAPPPAYEPPAAAAPPPAAAPAPAYEPPAAAAPPAYQPPAAAPPAAAPPAAAPPAAAPPAAEPKTVPKLWAQPSGPTEADFERIYSQTYSPDIEAERQQKIQFYQSLGKSPQEAQRIAARVLGYAQVKELVDAAPNQYAD